MTDFWNQHLICLTFTLYKPCVLYNTQTGA